VKQILIICMAALLPAFAQWQLQPPDGWRSRNTDPAGESGDGERITAATLRTWTSPFLWVDARPRSEFEIDHMPGAVLLNEDSWDSLLPEFLAQWQPGKPVVVYCGAGCESSRRVALRLRVAGVSDIRVLEGGWDAAKSLRP
jgi:rhodanese-related sulfurtransferase